MATFHRLPATDSLPSFELSVRFPRAAGYRGAQTNLADLASYYRDGRLASRCLTKRMAFRLCIQRNYWQGQAEGHGNKAAKRGAWIETAMQPVRHYNRPLATNPADVLAETITEGRPRVTPG